MGRRKRERRGSEGGREGGEGGRREGRSEGRREGGKEGREAKGGGREGEEESKVKVLLTDIQIHTDNADTLTVYLPSDPIDPSDGNELKQPNKQEGESSNILVKQLKQVDSVAKDKGNTHYEHQYTDDSCTQ